MIGRPKKKLGKKTQAFKPKRATKEEQDKLEKDVDGLLPNWVLFIDEYFSNGFNATQAYLKVYKVKSNKVACACAARLISYASVQAEIQYRLNSQKITKDAISSELWEVGTKYRGAKTLGAAVSALGILAKASGMLVDDINLKGRLTTANFLPLISKKTLDDQQAKMKNGERITE